MAHEFTCGMTGDTILVKEHGEKPDPHKEWVKIREGCPMPEVGQYIDCKLISGERMMFRYYDTEDVTMISTHWRYPHPDPEDV